MRGVLLFLTAFLVTPTNGFIRPQGAGCGAILAQKMVNYTITATADALNSSLDTSHALLNDSGAWCSKPPSMTSHHLIIELERQANVTGVAMRGQGGYSHYVTQFKLLFKEDFNSNLKYFPSNLNSKTFETAPVDGDEIVEFYLNQTAMVTLRFVPTAWNSLICLRVEVYGCVPVDGAFTSWSGWSGCSTSCGKGTQLRTRSCANPQPANGGNECEGVIMDTRDCNRGLCPVDGGLGEWGEWTPCSTTCGPGFQLRSRQCSNPVPENGGKDCHGNTGDARACNLSRCELDANMRASTSCKAQHNAYFVTMLILVGVVIIFVVFSIVKHRKKGSSVEASEQRGMPLRDNNEARMPSASIKLLVKEIS